MRIPDAPNGHATNREAVKPDRPPYPHASPRPAAYNSPPTPAGTRRNHPSSTNNAAPGTGAPIGTTPDPALNGALKATHIVVSVGPYSLIITRPGAHRSTTSAGQGPPLTPRRPPPQPTTSAGQASPPTNKVTDSKPCGDNIPTADGV